MVDLKASSLAAPTASNLGSDAAAQLVSAVHNLTKL